MSARQQYVSMVARGGLGVTLVDAKGNPYATTGDGALVFNRAPILIDPIFEGAASINRVIMGLGSEQLPALQIGPLATGWYAPTEDRLAITLNGNTTVQFNPDGVAIIGNLSYSGQLTGAYHDPLTADGDIYVRLGGISTRLPKGAPGEVLQSNASGLQWGSVTGTGTVNLINTQPGELTGGPITVSGTLGLADTAVSPGTYGTSISVAAFNVDQKGRLTLATPVAIDVPLSLGYTPADVAQPLSQFAATTSAQLAGVITNETGSAGGGVLVFSNTPQLTSPQMSGVPTAPTAAPGTNTQQLATTQFLQAAITALNLSQYAPLNSPVFTGDPTAPTPATADNDTSIATTAFVKNQGYLTTTVAGTTYLTIANPAFTGTLTGPTVSVTGAVRAFNGTAPPAGGTLGSGFMLGNVANFGVMYGTGTPDKAAPVGTIYLRGQAPGAPYYNADGTATGWQPIGGGVSIGTTPPTPAVVGQQWWNSELGQMFIRYDDSNSVQWVPSSPAVSPLSSISADDWLVYTGGFPLNNTQNVVIATFGPFGAAGQKWEFECCLLMGSNQSTATICGVDIFDVNAGVSLAGGGGVNGFATPNWFIPQYAKAQKVLTGPQTISIRASGNAAGALVSGNGSGGLSNTASWFSGRRLI